MFMSVEQLSELATCELIEIGSHSITHPLLAQLTPERQAHEIRGSKKALEEIVARTVVSFAYPYGSKHTAYSDSTVREVIAAGFSSACTGTPGTARYGANKYELPRDVVLDWDGDEFSKRLRWWLIR